MSIALVFRPPFAKAGRTLLWAVAGFGVATIVFGISTSFYISLAALLIAGAFDAISVVVRQTLVQLLTPDPMRGRVSAISGMFIGGSNELGGFESGLVAEWTTPVISVISGGIGTLIVVAGSARGRARAAPLRPARRASRAARQSDRRGRRRKTSVSPSKPSCQPADAAGLAAAFSACSGPIQRITWDRRGWMNRPDKIGLRRA